MDDDGKLGSCGGVAGGSVDGWREALQKRSMFDPPLEGSLIAGVPLYRVPESEVKYASFLEWWFEVGRKAPSVTTDGWSVMSGPNSTRGRKEIIPQEDWEKLPESEREAIREWTEGCSIGLMYD